MKIRLYESLIEVIIALGVGIPLILGGAVVISIPFCTTKGFCTYIILSEMYPSGISSQPIKVVIEESIAAIYKQLTYLLFISTQF